MKLLVVLLFPLMAISQNYSQLNLEGSWLGIDMYQDEETYDGKNYFLPNNEFLIIEDSRLKVYFYPFAKSDEFPIEVTEKEIIHKVGSKKIETNYSFLGKSLDTLVFTMHFINKTFVKMYTKVTSMNERMEVDFATIQELDEFGFNPSSINHLFELDTLHKERKFGFNNYDSLAFEPYRFIQFINDRQLSINRGEAISFKRGYRTIEFDYLGKHHAFTISRVEGTQSFALTPNSLCNCDSIAIPYMTVDWADRIRKDMRENAFKYRD